MALQSLRIAVVGAGIYGSAAAVRLSQEGHTVSLYDPLGVLRAASSINQCRVHAGYHYPRSPETIAELLEAREEFLHSFAPAIVRGTFSYYAIPRSGSRTSVHEYEQIMSGHGLPLRSCRPAWLNFSYIDRCYEVEEQLYDPDALRRLVEARLAERGVPVHLRPFSDELRGEFDRVVYATYGMGPSLGVFDIAKYQVAEKVLIDLPDPLRQVSLVIVDGPFTAFDPYGETQRSLFGSALHTNHWSTDDAREAVPESYARLLNRRDFDPVPFTHFDAMVEDCSLAVPAARAAKYLGSRFTMRVVEDHPASDRRVLYWKRDERRDLHVFSGKVVSALKAARIVCELIAADG